MFLESFYDDTLLPGERLQKAWYCKTFFVLWNESTIDSKYFISDKTFQDLKCATDRLFHYMLIMNKQFPDAPILTKYLGSEPNENGFGFARTGQHSGRRTNLDGLDLAYRMEKMNKHSEVNNSPEDAGHAIAHTRGRRVLRKPPCTQEVLPKKTRNDILGKDIDIKHLVVCMEQGTKDCIDDCRDFGLDFVKLSNTSKKDERIGSGDDNSSDNNFDDNEECSSGALDEFTFGITSEELTENFADENDTVKTPLGTFNRRRAETFYINGGRSTIGAKSRASRFYYNIFEKSKLDIFNKEHSCPIETCQSSRFLQKGDTITLKIFQRKNAKRHKKITGTVQFISKNLNPVKSVCKEHGNSPNGGFTVWLLRNGEYHRCIF